jgi:hypothetical protein
MTHTLTGRCIHYRWCAWCKWTSCILCDPTVSWRSQPSGVWCRVVWQRGISVWETLSATIGAKDEGSRLLRNLLPLRQTTWHCIPQDNQLQASLFLTPMPVDSQKTMCWGSHHSLILCHLWWHLVTAACKQKVCYLQVLTAVVKMTVTWSKLSHPEDCSSTFLPNIRINHAHHLC